MNIAEPTGEQILAIPMPKWGDTIGIGGGATIGEALIALLNHLWEQKSDFNGKRAFGVSFWEHDFYQALGAAGLITCTFDEDGNIDDADTQAGDRLVALAIQTLGDPLRSNLPCACADPHEVQCPRHGHLRCSSCGHEIGEWHRDEGCWHAVTVGTVGKPANCPCSVPWREARACAKAPALHTFEGGN